MPKILEVTAPEQVELTRAWGRYTKAVETAFDFWQWWDNDPDSDQKLANRPGTVLEKTIAGQLPEIAEVDADLPRMISDGIRMLTNKWAGTIYMDAFNDAVFTLETEPERLSDEIYMKTFCSRFGINDRQARDLFGLAKLAVSEGDEDEHEVIAAELQPGYKLGDEVIRPAMVKVKRSKK